MSFRWSRRNSGQGGSHQACEAGNNAAREVRGPRISEVQAPGEYVLRAGTTSTRPFQIGQEALAREYLEGHQFHVQRTVWDGGSRDPRHLPYG